MGDPVVPTVYINLSPKNRAYLADQAEESDIPMAQVADAIINEARKLGWSVRHNQPFAQVVRPRDPVSGGASGAAADLPPTSAAAPYVRFSDKETPDERDL